MIRLEQISKRYGKFLALDNVNLQIEKGQVFGFVGPNGAGKTTTISILATLIRPTSGQAYINGYEVAAQPIEVRRSIGYMPDFFGVYDRLKVTEYLEFFAAAYQIPHQKRKSLIADLLALVNLSHKADDYVDALSRGMKQRLGLARCLIHNPSVLLLDEPASGLDPRSRIEMREILKELRAMGKTIIISSHILPELEEMCDVIGIIENGRIISTGTIEEMNAKIRGYRLLCVRLLGQLEQTELLLRRDGRIHSLQRENDTLHFAFAGSQAEQSALLQSLVNGGLPVVSFSEQDSDLEDLFLAISQGKGI